MVQPLGPPRRLRDLAQAQPFAREGDDVQLRAGVAHTPVETLALREYHRDRASSACRREARPNGKKVPDFTNCLLSYRA